ncbi:MAG TPA: low affinity iron permease family protein [Gemmatimonadales bacterium]|nr:low affinity iron permease family protein [Gemmatimonadales bacterium]
MTVADWFARFSRGTARITGSPVTFFLAVLAIIAWAVTGPVFRYSDTWQLVINTATTIVTFLMVFLIQNTQNRDATAMHIKLDELIRAVHGARTRMVSLEDLTEEQLAQLKKQFEQLAKTAEEVGDAVDDALADGARGDEGDIGMPGPRNGETRRPRKETKVHGEQR